MESIGTVPIDAIFSPVRKINYTVTPARVGRETDFDRLNFEIWTDGTVTPAEAVGYAAKILKACGGNYAAAARRMEIDRSTLKRWRLSSL